MSTWNLLKIKADFKKEAENHPPANPKDSVMFKTNKMNHT